MVFAEVVDFFVAWLSCLLADTLVLFCSNIWSLLIRSGVAEQQNVRQWCGKMKGCNPKLCIESQTFVLRENFEYVWENNLGVFGFGHYESAITNFLFCTFVSEICSVTTRGCRLKVKPRKFLMFFPVCVCVYFLVKFSLFPFLSHIWWYLSKVQNIFTINLVRECYLEALPMTIW